MDIIAKNAPMIDSANLNESLETFRSYIVEVLQVIDFTLSNQKNKINGAVSEQNFLQLAASVQALKSELTSHGAEITAISKKIDEISADIKEINKTLETLSGSVESLEGRVTALEQAS